MDDERDLDLVRLASDVTVAWLGNPAHRVPVNDVAAIVETVYAALRDVSTGDTSGGSVDVDETHEPAVTVRRSLASKDHILSLIDGKPYRTLRKHLTAKGLTPDEYRERYGLRPDYPMVAESYAQMRRDMAKKIGLGRKGRGRA